MKIIPILFLAFILVNSAAAETVDPFAEYDATVAAKEKVADSITHRLQCGDTSYATDGTNVFMNGEQIFEDFMFAVTKRDGALLFHVQISMGRSVAGEIFVDFDSKKERTISVINGTDITVSCK
jgi:hypothetical protein